LQGPPSLVEFDDPLLTSCPLHSNFYEPKFFLDVKCTLDYIEKLKFTEIATIKIEAVIPVSDPYPHPIKALILAIMITQI
jgi:hypothetical protein